MGQYGFDRACFSVVFRFLLCFIAHLYEANGGTDMEVLACFRPVFFYRLNVKTTPGKGVKKLGVRNIVFDFFFVKMVQKGLQRRSAGIFAVKTFFTPFWGQNFGGEHFFIRFFPVKIVRYGKVQRRSRKQFQLSKHFLHPFSRDKSGWEMLPYFRGNSMIWGFKYCRLFAKK